MILDLVTHPLQKLTRPKKGTNCSKVNAERPKNKIMLGDEICSCRILGVKYETNTENSYLPPLKTTAATKLA